MRYKIIISKETLYEIEIEADNWEEAAELAEERFQLTERGFQEIESNFEATDYELIHR